jgi:hypothetical protein
MQKVVPPTLGENFWGKKNKKNKESQVLCGW